MSQEDDERLIALESKLAHQEYLLDSLNQTVYRLQKQLDELDTLASGLIQQVAQLRAHSSDNALPHEKPPHY